MLGRGSQTGEGEVEVVEGEDQTRFKARVFMQWQNRVKVSLPFNALFNVMGIPCALVLLLNQKRNSTKGSPPSMPISL